MPTLHAYFCKTSVISGVGGSNHALVKYREHIENVQHERRCGRSPCEARTAFPIGVSHPHSHYILWTTSNRPGVSGAETGTCFPSNLYEKNCNQGCQNRSTFGRVTWTMDSKVCQIEAAVKGLCPCSRFHWASGNYSPGLVLPEIKRTKMIGCILSMIIRKEFEATSHPRVHRAQVP